MQRTDEWLENYNHDYFDRQFRTPYRSTVAFCDWLEKRKLIEENSAMNILDVGTGKGANLFYMAQRLSAARFTGVDINPEFVNEGNKIMASHNLDKQIRLEIADIYNFDRKYVNSFDGIVSLQTLSWLPDFAPRPGSSPASSASSSSCS